MSGLRLKNETRYITLGGDSARMAGRRGFNVIPQSRSVQLSGKNWRWSWNQPSGVIIQKGGAEKRLPIFDFTRVIQVILYGLSMLCVLLGFFNFRGKRRGAGYG
jgi:hypothetical protein